MIISQTPFRISFFGGGTDYPAWYRQHGGAVLSTTIDKYCHISCRNLPHFFAYRHRIVYSLIELVNEIEEIRHPSIRECMRQVPTPNGLEIHHDGDLPARSGLGSSSAFTVGMLNTLRAMNGLMSSKSELAKGAIHVEHEMIREAVGAQDQIAAAYGGLNRIAFAQDGSFRVEPLLIPAERRDLLQSHLMLFFTGFQRYATEIAAQKIQNLPHKTTELARMQEMVDEAIAMLSSPATSLDEFGRLLHESWMLKRSLAGSVTTDQIDQIYEAGRAAGAIGGKLLGAGGGGFMLFFVRPEHRGNLQQALSNLVHVNFKFETQGSRIALYDPNF